MNNHTGYKWIFPTCEQDWKNAKCFRYYDRHEEFDFQIRRTKKGLFVIFEYNDEVKVSHINHLGALMSDGIRVQIKVPVEMKMIPFDKHYVLEDGEYLVYYHHDRIHFDQIREYHIFSDDTIAFITITNNKNMIHTSSAQLQMMVYA